MKTTITTVATAAAKTVATAAQQVQRSALHTLEKQLRTNHENIVADLLERFEQQNKAQKENVEAAAKAAKDEVNSLRETVRALREQLNAVDRRSVSIPLDAADLRRYRMPSPQPVRRRRRRDDYDLAPPPQPLRRRTHREYDPRSVTYTGSSPLPQREPVSRRLTYGESPPSHYRRRSHHYDDTPPYSRRR